MNRQKHKDDENIKPPTNDGNTPNGPPPTYEEALESLNYPSTPETLSNTSPSVQSSKLPLQIRAADPRSVICRCGQRVDASIAGSRGRLGYVQCRNCAYLVFPDGSSRYQLPALPCLRNGCSRTIPRYVSIGIQLSKLIRVCLQAG